METIDVLVKLPKTILSAAKIREKELSELLRQTFAVELYRLGQVSLGKAAEIAGISTKWDMLRLLAKHEVAFDYTADDLQQDIKTLSELGKL